MRIGAKKRPFYRVVAVDERAKRTGGYLELLGTYNPLTEPHEVRLKQERIDALVQQGAKFSDGYLRMIGKAPKRPPRKPKKAASAQASEPKEKKEESKTAEETQVNTSEVESGITEENTSEVKEDKAEVAEHANPKEKKDEGSS